MEPLDSWRMNEYSTGTRAVVGVGGNTGQFVRPGGICACVCVASSETRTGPHACPREERHTASDESPLPSRDTRCATTKIFCLGQILISDQRRYLSKSGRRVHVEQHWPRSSRCPSAP